MKRIFKTSLIALALTGFFLSGCQNKSNESSISELAADKRLSVTTSKQTYDQYEVFSYSSLTVDALVYENDELVSTEKGITDFKVYGSDGNEIKDGGKITNSSAFDEPVEFTVVKDGYVKGTFTLTIRKSKDFRQELSVSAPNKIDYKYGETVDLSGLVVTVQTDYYTGSDNYITKKDVLGDTEYTLTINGKSADNYVIDGYGVHTGTVEYLSFSKNGEEKIISATFYLYCAHDSISTEPVDYSYHTDSDWVDDDRTVTIEIKNSTKNNTDKGYLSPDEINTPKNLFDYGQNNAQKWQYTQGTGNIPFLIIPLVIPGYDYLATPDLWNTINDAFFADSTDMPFESLRSYYSKASGGQLNITGTVTDYYYPEKLSKTFNTYFDFANPNNNLTPFIEEALEWAKETYDLDLSKYDTDHNGTIDGAWFVYVYDKKSTTMINFWAYSSSTQLVGTAENPKINNFGWLGSQFLLDSAGDDKGNDAHVIIHESGHMFGLSDYYSYNQTTADRYAPLGRADMMDNNCSDQNPFSKLMMGWQKPYVVTGNCTITIKADQNLNQCILIPYDSKDYTAEKYQENGKTNLNLFDEYLLIDFYTDKNLNEKGYAQYSVESISGYGVRIYHVDNRLCKVNSRKSDDTYSSELVDADTGLEMLSDGQNDVIKAINNTESGERSESERYGLPSSCNYYDEVRLIYADKTYASYKNYATTSSLFSPNGDLSVNSSFTITDYKDQFVNGTFDNNEAFSYSIQVKNY